MNGDPPRKPKSARRVAFAKWAFVGAIAGAALISACSQPSDSQQTAQQQASDEQAPKEADEKAWADAEKAGTAAAYTAYIQNFGGGAHVAEARQRVGELSRKEADDKAWADAVRAGTHFGRLDRCGFGYPVCLCCVCSSRDHRRARYAAVRNRDERKGS